MAIVKNLWAPKTKNYKLSIQIGCLLVLIWFLLFVLLNNELQGWRGTDSKFVKDNDHCWDDN